MLVTGGGRMNAQTNGPRGKGARRLLAAGAVLAALALAAGPLPAAAEPFSAGVTLAGAQYQSFAGTGSFPYGDQLNPQQKKMYDALKTMTPTDTRREAELTSLSWARDDAGNQLNRAFQGAIDALIKDYPEMFWLDIADTIEKGKVVTVDTSQQGGNIITSVKTTFDFSVIDGAADKARQVSQAIAAFPVGGNTRYEKLRSIHDGLSKRVSYDDAAVQNPEGNPHSWDAYGALIKGKAVCEGYAEAFKLLCDREGIPCVLIVGDGVGQGGTGEPHMWNAVYMDDQKQWYAVDVTWDDQPRAIFYTFFLTGSEVAGTDGFPEVPFSQSHVADGNFTGTVNSPVFAFPTLSAGRYDPSAPPPADPDTGETVSGAKPEIPAAAEPAAPAVEPAAATVRPDAATTVKPKAAATQPEAAAATAAAETTAAVGESPATEPVAPDASGEDTASGPPGVNRPGGLPPLAAAAALLLAGAAAAVWLAVSRAGKAAGKKEAGGWNEDK